ncbi:uncharacterized protein LOC112572904 isoform X3 [Pomacea canaliculata]|uniref:uncharacterized protein LOC112572904 isoform X3 n=1 Tax=Pomacea canaliculata TaxID=400727 RepID=UPI000D72A3B7|nr:uncharacterized protein LOC112572904 isoform X3 [Pomacea canaliculata]
MPGKTRGLPDSFSCPCSVKDQCMDIPEPWMERLLPYTDLLKGVEWQDSNGRVFFLDDHGVFRPFSWDRLASGEMCDWRELEGLPYNIGEILQQFTSMPLDRIHHYAYMGEYLRVLYDEKKLLDVLIHVGNKVFAAHRIALACHSIYFSRAFILTHHHDNKLSEVILNGIDPAAFQTILSFVPRFIYSGILYVNDCNVQSLLAVAGTLQIPAVYFRCRDFLGTLTLEPSPLREVNPNAIRMKYSHIIDNFGYAATMDVFYALPVDTVEVILGDDNIKVSSEMEVFDAVMNWIGYEPGLRRRHMDRLMQKVRFPCMSCEEVIQCSQANDQVSYSPALKNKIMEATWILTLRKVNSYDPFHLPCPHPRKCFSEGLYSSSSKIVISAVKSQYSVGGMHAECTLFSKADEENIVFAPPLCSTFREPSGRDFTVPSTPVTGPSLYHPPQSPVKSAPEIVGNYVENSVAPPLLQKSSSSGAPAYLQFKASELVLETQQQETLTPSSSTPSVMSVANEGKSRRDKSRTKGQTSKASGIFSRAESNPEITVELQIQGENSKLQGISAGLTISPPDKSINRDKKKTDSTLMPGGSLDNRRSPGHSPAGGETSSKSPLNKTERASSRSRAKAKKTSTNSGSQSRFPGPMSKEGATSQISEKFSSEVFQFSQASKTDSVLRGSSSTSSSQDFHPNLLPLTVESSSSSTLPPTSPFSTPSPTVIQLKEVPQPYLKFYINDEQGEGRITVVKSNSSSTSTVSLPPGVGDILAVGGFMETDDNESASQTSLYNGDNRNWHRFSNMPETRINFAAAFLNDVLYVIGGYDPHDMDCMCRAARDVFTLTLRLRDPFWRRVR